MLTRQELEDLIKAWPDENGVSSDPDTYNAWLKRDHKPYAHIFDGLVQFGRTTKLLEKQNRH